MRSRCNTTHSEGFEDRALGNRAAEDRKIAEQSKAHDLAMANVRIGPGCGPNSYTEAALYLDSRSKLAPAPVEVLPEPKPCNPLAPKKEVDQCSR